MTIRQINDQIRATKRTIDMALKDKWEYRRWAEIVIENCNEAIALAKQDMEELKKELALREFKERQLPLFAWRKQ